MVLRGIKCGRAARVVSPACVLAMAGLVMSAPSASASGSAPSLTLSPSANFHDGESIAVSVGANGYFTPSTRVNILECADPGGSVANLPTSISTCDGNTIQGNTILVGSNGSFSEADYTLYVLPSSILGEQSNDQPVCNQTNPCVLYVGQNQNDFTAPKIFSAPFSVASSSGTSTTTSTTSSTAKSTTTTSVAGATTTVTSAPTSSTTMPTTSAVDPTVNVVSAAASATGTLPNTGLPAGALWIVIVGGALLLTGAIGRKMSLRTRR
jgi:LPXTG-motif cell wall-anchored protein